MKTKSIFACFILLFSINCMAISYEDNSQIDNYYSYAHEADTSFYVDTEPSMDSIAKPEDMNINYFTAMWEMIKIPFKLITGSPDV